MTIEKLKKAGSLLVVLLLLSVQIKAQVKLAQTGLQFLEIGVSPRAEAMGGAFVIAGDNSSAMFYNPAGIASISKEFDFTFNRVQWFADIAYNAAGITYNPSDGLYGVFGISIINTDYGDFKGTRVSNNSAGFEDTGIFTPSAIAIGLSYGNQLTDKFSIGGQIKYVAQSLGSNIHTAGGSEIENSVSGFAFDFGMIYRTGLKGFDFGMSIKNFATDFKYEEYAFEAPITFRIGLSLSVLEVLNVNDEDQYLLLAVDAVHPRDYEEHLDLGLEYKLFKIISLRGGYKVNYSEQSFTAGIGLDYKVAGLDLRVNYAYGAFGIWSNVQRLSIGFGL